MSLTNDNESSIKIPPIISSDHKMIIYDFYLRQLSISLAESYRFEMRDQH